MTPCLGLSSQVSRWYHFLRWDIEREVSLDHHVSDVMGYCESSSGACQMGGWKKRCDPQKRDPN